MGTQINNIEEAKNLPLRLYKYLNWNNPDKSWGNQWLIKPEVYFATPKQLNHDSETNWNYDLSRLNEESSRVRAIEQDMRGANPLEIEQAVTDHLRLVRTLRASEQKQEEYIRNLKNRWNNNAGVLSFTKYWYNPNMWNSQFGQFGKGYCIGYNPLKLAKNIEIFQSGDIIKYHNGSSPKIHVPHPLPKVGFNQWLEWLFTLPKDIKHEEEFRFAFLNKEEEEKEGYSRVSQNQPINPKAMVEVYTGPSMSTQNKKEIADLCQSKYPWIKITEVNQSHLDGYHL